MPNHEAPPERTLLQPPEWPAGHRAALAIMVALDPDPRQQREGSPANDAFGATHLFEMLQDFDVGPTVVLEADPPYEAPVPQGLDCDGAMMGSGDDLRLDTGRAAVQRRLGTELRGVVLPDHLAPESVTDSALWTADMCPAPFPMRTQGGTVVVPLNPTWVDATWFAGATVHPPSAMLETWSLSLQSVRSRGQLMVVMLNAFVAGQPGVVETVQRFLDEAVGAGDVWITNGSSIASHVSASTAQE